MSYIDDVVLASANAATTESAPEELSLDVTPEAVESIETEAPVESFSELPDPCWSEFSSPEYLEYLPSADIIDAVIENYNSKFGSSRHISTADSYSVARKALEKYEYLSDQDLYSAILWEIHSFAEYATTGATADGDDFSSYAEFAAEGHPDTESSVVAAATWVAGAPDLDNSGREALLTAFNENTDYVKSLHASTRVRAMVSSGNLSETTLQQIKNLSARYLQVN